MVGAARTISGRPQGQNRRRPDRQHEEARQELQGLQEDHREVLHDDLGLKSYACTPRHLLAASLKKKRLEKCQKILNNLRHHGPTMKISSDKKIITIDRVYDRRNDRWLAETTEGYKGVFCTKNPARVMVLGVLVNDGRKMPPTFFKPGEKINSDVY